MLTAELIPAVERTIAELKSEMASEKAPGKLFALNRLLGQFQWLLDDLRHEHTSNSK